MRANRLKRRPIKGAHILASLIFPLLFVATPQIVLPGERSSYLDRQILKLISQPKLETGFWGIQIVSVKKNEVLFALNEKKHFLPASNMKLIVAAAALDSLGADYQFETCVYAQGRIDYEGKLLGDLVLVGSGDPNVEGRLYNSQPEPLARNRSSSLFIEQIVDQIVRRGIRSVQGDVVGDDTAFLYEPYAPGWEHADLLWSYGAPASALAVNENVFTIEVWPGSSVGEPALVNLIPSFEGVNLVNNVTTVLRVRSNSVGIDRAGGRLVLQGEVSKDQGKLDYTLAVEDPAEFAASLLKSALEQRGVQITGRVRAHHLYPLEVFHQGGFSVERARSLQPRYPPEQKLASTQSVKLIETVKIMMKVSHNLYAEVLLRKLGAEAVGVGSIENGVAAVKSFLAKTGTSEEELNISDGSGLSRTDLVTPRSMVRLLLYMQKHSQTKLFLDTLPVSGIDGTLEHRMNKSAVRGRILAKTGTSALVNSLSGYALTESGDTLAFSIMVNNLNYPAQEIRGAVDQICALMAHYHPKKDAADQD